MYVWVERGVAEDTLLRVTPWFLGTWKWPLVWRTVKEEHIRQEDRGSWDLNSGLKVWRRTGVCLRKALGVFTGRTEAKWQRILNGSWSWVLVLGTMENH